jgi:hypothetical protein
VGHTASGGQEDKQFDVLHEKESVRVWRLAAARDEDTSSG